jgi:uncharacterized membrane protein
MSEKPPAGWYPDSKGNTRWWDGNQWTDHAPPPPPPPSEPPPSQPPPSETAAQEPALFAAGDSATRSQSRADARASEPKKKRRVFLWFFLAIQVLFIVWIIGGASTGAGTPEDCTGLSEEACNAASDIGTSIGVALIIGVWVVVDFLLAVIYGVYRLATKR